MTGLGSAPLIRAICMMLLASGVAVSASAAAPAGVTAESHIESKVLATSVAAPSASIRSAGECSHSEVPAANANFVVVLVHGWRDSAVGMTPMKMALQARLGEQFEVVAFDYSGRNREWPSGVAADCLASYLTEAGDAPGHASTPRRVFVVAHSLGGILARFASVKKREPAAFSGLVTVGTPHLGSPWGATAYSALLGRQGAVLPGSSAAVCLAAPGRRPDSCETPPPVPDSVPIAQIGTQLWVTRTLFGMGVLPGPAARFPLIGDTIVPGASATGYLRSVPRANRRHPVGVTAEIIDCETSTDDFSKLLSGARRGPAGAAWALAFLSTQSLALDQLVSFDGVNDQAGVAIGIATNFAAVHPCSHLRQLTHPEVLAAVADRLNDWAATAPATGRGLFTPADWKSWSTNLWPTLSSATTTTSLVSGEAVIVGAGSDRGASITALSRRDGQVLWQHDEPCNWPEQLHLTGTVVWMSCHRPSDNGTERYVGLDVATGAVRWRHDLWDIPSVVFNGHDLFAMAMSRDANAVERIDPATGRRTRLPQKPTFSEIGPFPGGFRVETWGGDVAYSRDGRQIGRSRHDWLEDDVVGFATDGSRISRVGADGSVLWQTPLTGEYVDDAERYGAVLVVATSQGGYPVLSGYAVRTGRRLWTAPDFQGPDSVLLSAEQCAAGPVVETDTGLHVISAASGEVALSVRPSPRSTEMQMSSRFLGCDSRTLYTQQTPLAAPDHWLEASREPAP